MTEGRPTLSVVLPSFHGAALLARHVPTLLAHLEQLGVSHEVVVADDGTPDEGATARIAAALGCRYVRNPTNEGKGAAVRRGMLAARGDYRIFTDCDVPYELDAFDRFLHYLDAKEYHFVTGDRTLEASSYYTEIPRLRTLGSHVYSFLVGRFVAGGWFDTQCGLKGFRAAAAEDLFRVGKIPGFAFDVELFYVALKRNYDIKRLPVRLRVQEGSSVRIVRDGLAMTGDLAVIRWHQLAGHYRPVSPVIVGIDSSPRGGQGEAR